MFHIFHSWGTWVNIKLNVVDVKPNYKISVQQRTCKKCGITESRRPYGS